MFGVEKQFRMIQQTKTKFKLKTKKIVFFLGTLMLFSVIIVSAFQMNFWLSNTLLLVYIGLIGYSERALLKRLVKAKAS